MSRSVNRGQRKRAAARNSSEAQGRVGCYEDEPCFTFWSIEYTQAGKTLEGVLHGYFKASDIHVRDACTLHGSEGEDILEHIDGVVGIDGQLYLVEMKWRNEPVGVEAVQQHISRHYMRAQANGIFISTSGYT